MKKANAKTTAQYQLALPEVELTETGLSVKNGMNLDQWKEVGEKLGRCAKSTLWWIGDWLAHGEKTYGTTYDLAQEVTGLEYGTLANSKNVAEAIEFSRRRENLSWCHHQVVASLPAPEQTNLLKKAERERWSVKKLREEKSPRLFVEDPDEVPTDESFGIIDSEKEFGVLQAEILAFYVKYREDEIAMGRLEADLRSWAETLERERTNS